jgi:hypothetical protein
VLDFRLGSPATVGKEYAHSLEGLNLASVAFGFGEEKKSLFGWVQAEGSGLGLKRKQTSFVRGLSHWVFLYLDANANAFGRLELSEIGSVSSTLDRITC